MLAFDQLKEASSVFSTAKALRTQETYVVLSALEPSKFDPNGQFILLRRRI